MKQWILIFVTLLFVAGCSKGHVQSAGDTAVKHDIQIDLGVVFPDHGPDIQDTWLETEAIGPTDVVQDSDTHEITPGTKGWPCTKNEDCYSGFCIQAADGRRCANLCGGDVDCDPGFSCVQVSPPPDVVSACVYRYPNLCLPCIHDSDCKAQLVPGDTLCVAWVPAVDANGKETGGVLPGYGVEGAFCGGPCKTDADCPLDYVCRLTHSIDGRKAKQCVLAQGSCGCDQRAADTNMKGACFVKNTEGTCQGTHTCTRSGMSSCDAPIPAPETCNGKDDNCNGQTDEDYQPHECTLKNQYGQCKGTTVCENGQEKCTGHTPEPEKCDGQDDNCNGQTDEENAKGCKPFYKDHDHDGYGLGGDYKCLCKGEGEYTATQPGDCNDGNPDVHPGAKEVCNGLDDDCDSVTDPVGAPGCKDYYKDADNDGHGDINGTPKCLCAPMKPYVVTSHDDCDDTNPEINPDKPERCNFPDPIDDNCDGITDPPGSKGCTPFYYDLDQDGYGDDTKKPKCLCRAGDVANYTAPKGGDCDDNDPKRSPGLKEKCGDNIDNDCNGKTDEDGADGCIRGYIDKDKDGWGGGKGRCMCHPVAPYTCLKGGDCNDNDPKINPGADEVCGNSVDENCNGNTNDPGAVGCKPYYVDHDKDHYGTKQQKCLCIPEGDYTALNTGDCNDNDPAINPGVKEICGNSVDENCNGVTDDAGAKGCTVYYYDGDNDGWGTGNGLCLCKPSADFHVTRNGDCDDKDKNVHPGATEICDGKDNDCLPGTPADPEDAQGCKPYYPDADHDGFGAINASPRCLCGPDTSSGFTTLDHTDCNDHDKNVNPGVKEKCNAGTDTDPLVDENCNGVTDEENAAGCKPYYFDNDGDGEGIVDDRHKARCLCHPDKANKYTALTSDDCNDNNAKIGSGFDEYCDNLDNNCNGLTDEEGVVDGTNYYFDGDQDGFGTGKAHRLCSPDYQDRITSKYDNDCNDDNKDIHPGVTGHPGGAICGIDADCDGSPLDQGEECDDGNNINWDGCTSCKHSEFRINQVVQRDQDKPAIAPIGDGTFVAVWESESADTSGYGIVARRFDSTMKMLSDDLTVNTTTPGNQQAPAVAVPQNGKPVVAWAAYGQDGDGWGVYAQILDVGTNGALRKSGTEFRVNQVTAHNQQSPALAPCGTDCWVGAYVSDASGSNKVMVRRFEGATAKTSAINPDNVDRQAESPDIAWISNDRVVVVWEAKVGTDDYDCFARVLSLPGLSSVASAPNPIRVNQFHTGYQTRPRVAAVSGGGFVVTWVSLGQDGNGAGVIARRFSAGLTPASGDIIVNTTSAGSQIQPDVAHAGDGFFIIWTSENQDGSSYGVYGRRYDASGTSVTGEIGFNSFVSGMQWQPRIAGGTSKIIAVWSSADQDGDGMGIFGRPNEF